MGTQGLTIDAKLLGVSCLALVSGAAATKCDLGGLVGKWQGVCVQKASSHNHGGSYGCTDDVISYPYYVEYSYDSYKRQYFTQYRQDGYDVHAPTYDYSEPQYSGKGKCEAYQTSPKSSHSQCVNVWYEDGSKRTYRTTLKHEGDLDFIIEEGERNIGLDHSGVWGKCPTKSWQPTFCSNWTYSYRCYLVKTKGLIHWW